MLLGPIQKKRRRCCASPRQLAPSCYSLPEVLGCSPHQDAKPVSKTSMPTHQKPESANFRHEASPEPGAGGWAGSAVGFAAGAAASWSSRTLAVIGFVLFFCGLIVERQGKKTSSEIRGCRDWPPGADTTASTATRLGDPTELTCLLPICQLHKDTAPRLFILEHTDGAGHRLKSVLEAIAISWRNNINFGGLVGQLWPLTDQHINIRVVVDAVFGAGASQKLYIYNITNKPRFQFKFNDVRALEAQVQLARPSAALFCQAVNEWTCPQSSASPESRRSLNCRCSFVVFS